MRFFLAGTVVFLAPLLQAQQPIGRTSATEVQVSGAVDISHGETLLGNGSQITAGEQAVNIALQRGGSLRLCSTSSVHLAKDRSIDDPASTKPRSSNSKSNSRSCIRKGKIRIWR